MSTGAKSSGSEARAGVPLGGVGTGCIEMGRDGHFRNLTINNNRNSHNRIPWAPSSFFAVRASIKDEISCRILQPTSAIPFAQNDIEAPYTTPKDISWYGLYPSSNYMLKEGSFPLGVRWSGLGPVIPYDIEASTLPLVMFAIQVHNPTTETIEFSALFNWENLRGCTAESSPADRGSISPVVLPDDSTQLVDVNARQLALEGRAPLGVTFGAHEGAVENADGNYCLIAVPRSGDIVSAMSWSPADGEDVAAFWNSFVDHGHVTGNFSEQTDAHCGAVCTSFRMDAGDTRRIAFLFSWFCPVYKVNGVDMGNGYTNQYRDSMEVVSYGIEHHAYFLKAVENWHQRFQSGSLPDWMSRMLVNNSSVLTTNSLYTKKGDFSLMESPDDPVVGALDRSFLSSLGTLLFFPALADKEMTLFTGSSDSKFDGRIRRGLGVECFHEPIVQDAGSIRVDVIAMFVLNVYRNYHLTGKLISLINAYPRMRTAMDNALELDKDGDGIPEVHGSDVTTYRGCEIAGLSSHVAGLWISALVAMVDLSRRLDHSADTRRYLSLLRSARSSFEGHLWSPERGYYQLYASQAKVSAAAEECHVGQFSGPWTSEFMQLEPVFSRHRFASALDAAQSLMGRSKGIANREGSAEDGDIGWPSVTAILCSCADLAFGRIDRGFESLRMYYRTFHGGQKHTFNLPLEWDVERGQPGEIGQDRHVSALAVWHALYAVQGFFMSVPDQSIHLAPKLAEGLSHLSTPLFTPLCFGWLTYQEERGDRLVQQYTISFDSPIPIKRIELGLPDNIGPLEVECTMDEESLAVREEVVITDRGNSLVITPTASLLVQIPIHVRIRHAQASPKPVEGIVVPPSNPV